MTKNKDVINFSNELKRRLNHIDRYHGGLSEQGVYIKDVETFDVDEVYETIDNILDGFPEDTGEV